MSWIIKIVKFVPAFGLSAFLLAWSPTLPAVAAEGAIAMDKEALEKAIHDYIMANPEVILESVSRFREREKQAEAESARDTVASHKAAIFDDPSAPVGGNPNGDVTLVEFFDYRCGVCKRVFPIVGKLVEKDANIRVVYKEWPILGPDSVFAARAALASRAQGKYQIFHDTLMQARGEMPAGRVLQIAKQIGLDIERLRKDISSAEIDEILKKNFKLAEALKITGTPSFVLGDQVVTGGRPLHEMEQLVAQARAQKE